MCFCLKIPYSIYIVDLLTLDSQPRALELMPEPSLSNTCIFFPRHITALSCWRTVHRASPAHSGALWNSKNFKKKHPNVETMSLNWPQKEHVLRAGALNQDGRAPGGSSWAGKCASGNLTWSPLHMWKFLEVGKCVNMESTSNEDWLHFVYPVSLHVVIQSA